MRHQRPTNAARGFSLAELMIASAIGLLVLASLSTLFVKNMRTQEEIEKSSRQIENGRYAIDQIASDLHNAGYYGEFDPTALANPAALPDPCAVDVPGVKAGLVLPVQGATASALSCLSDVRPATAAIVVRRTSTCVAGDAGCDAVSAGGPFFQASLCNNPTELDSQLPDDFYRLDAVTTTLDRHQRDCTQVAGSGTLAVVRRYLTRIYYIANNDNAGDGIPTLKRADLVTENGALVFTVVPLAEGIENLQVEYGMDLAPAGSGDGVADQFSAAPSSYNGCTTDDCAIANWRSVVSAKLALLARNTKTSLGYIDKKTYVLGHDADGNEISIGPLKDAWRRHAFETLVALPNPAGRRAP